MERKNMTKHEDIYSSLTEKEIKIKDKLLGYIRSGYSSTKIKGKTKEDIHELIRAEGYIDDSE